MSSETHPIFKRTLFYERRVRDGETMYQFYPFYLVTASPKLGGKIFEPVDCLKRQGPTDAIAGYKEINEIIEFDGKAKMFQCEAVPDTQLHSFQSWEWPLA